MSKKTKFLNLLAGSVLATVLVAAGHEAAASYRYRSGGTAAAAPVAMDPDAEARTNIQKLIEVGKKELNEDNFSVESAMTDLKNGAPVVKTRLDFLADLPQYFKDRIDTLKTSYSASRNKDALDRELDAGVLRLRTEMQQEAQSITDFMTQLGFAPSTGGSSGSSSATDLTAALTEKAALQVRLDKVDAERTTALENLQRMTEQKNKADEDLRLLQISTGDAGKTASDLQTKVAELMTQRDVLVAKKDELEAALHTKDSQISSLRATLNSTSSKPEDATTIHRLEEERAKLEQRLSALTSEQATQEHELADAKKQLERERERSEDLQDKILKATQEQAQLNLDITAVESERDKFRRTAEDLKEKLTKAEDQLRMATERVLSDDVAELQGKLEEAQNSLEYYEGNSRRLTMHLKAVEEDLAVQQRMRRELTMNFAANVSQIERDAREEYDTRAQQAQKKHEAEIATLAARLQENEKASQTLSQQAVQDAVKAKETELNAAHQHTLDDLLAEADRRVEAEVKKLTAAIKTHEQAVIVLTADKDKLASDKRTLEDEKKALEAEVVRLTPFETALKGLDMTDVDCLDAVGEKLVEIGSLVFKSDADAAVKAKNDELQALRDGELAAAKKAAAELALLERVNYNTATVVDTLVTNGVVVKKADHDAEVTDLQNEVEALRGELEDTKEETDAAGDVTVDFAPGLRTQVTNLQDEVTQIRDALGIDSDADLVQTLKDAMTQIRNALSLQDDADIDTILKAVNTTPEEEEEEEEGSDAGSVGSGSSPTMAVGLSATTTTTTAVAAGSGSTSPRYNPAIKDSEGNYIPVTAATYTEGMKLYRVNGTKADGRPHYVEAGSNDTIR